MLRQARFSPRSGIGIALDGFPIRGPHEPNGSKPQNLYAISDHGDVSPCNAQYSPRKPQLPPV